MRKKKIKHYIARLYDITPEHDKHIKKFSKEKGGKGSSAKIRELIDRDIQKVKCFCDY